MRPAHGQRPQPALICPSGATAAIAGTGFTVQEKHQPKPNPLLGPSKAARDAGFCDIRSIGETSDGRSLRVSVRGDKGPGYGSTSKMIAESGICLARDISHDAVGGGFWSTASAMREPLIARLQAEAGLTFTAESGPLTSRA
jgi:short subunit dehydrogenase-like uncharacterized protein